MTVFPAPMPAEQARAVLRLLAEFGLIRIGRDGDSYGPVQAATELLDLLERRAEATDEHRRALLDQLVALFASRPALWSGHLADQVRRLLTVLLEQSDLRLADRSDTYLDVLHTLATTPVRSTTTTGSGCRSAGCSATWPTPARSTRRSTRGSCTRCGGCWTGSPTRQTSPARSPGWPASWPSRSSGCARSRAARCTGMPSGARCGSRRRPATARSCWPSGTPPGSTPRTWPPGWECHRSTRSARLAGWPASAWCSSPTAPWAGSTTCCAPGWPS